MKKILFFSIIFASVFVVSRLLYGYSLHKKGYTLETFTKEITVYPETCEKHGVKYQVGKKNILRYEILKKETFDFKRFRFNAKYDTLSRVFYYQNQ